MLRKYSLPEAGVLKEDCIFFGNVFVERMISLGEFCSDKVLYLSMQSTKFYRMNQSNKSTLKCSEKMIESKKRLGIGYDSMNICC